MTTHKTLLATGIALSLTLVACGDSLTGEKQASAVETRYRNIAKAVEQNIQLANRNNPNIDMHYQLKDYQRGAQSSSADSALTLTLGKIYGTEADKPIIINLHDDIDHADALRKEKILAKINTTVSLAPETITALALNEQEKQQLDTALQHVKINGELLDEDKVKTHVEITPFEKTENDFSIKYEGLTADSTANQPTEGKLLTDGKGTLKSGTLTLHSKANTITLAPFDANFDSQSDKLSMATSAIKLEGNNSDNPRENFTFNIDNIKLDGKNLSYDEASQQLLGTNTLSLNDMTGDFDNRRNHVAFKQIKTEATVSKNGNNYDYTGDFVVTPSVDLVQQATGIRGLNINNATISYDLKNISLNSYDAVRSLYYTIASNELDVNDPNFSPELRKKIQVGINDIITNKNKLNGQLVIDTEAGKAEAKIQLMPKEDAKPITGDDMQQLDANLDQFIASIDLSIDQKIIEATGMKAMFEGYAAPYTKLEAGNYVSHIEISRDGIVINGQTFGQ